MAGLPSFPTNANAEVDYLKYDNCHARRDQWMLDRYTAMRDALNASGRPILYSLCQWGVMEPHLWAAPVGNSWRTTEVGALGGKKGKGVGWSGTHMLACLGQQLHLRMSLPTPITPRKASAG
jgi:hypothetical protein